MERIWNLATRLVKGMRAFLYDIRNRRLNLLSFERRRLGGDLILAYNILHGRQYFLRAEFIVASAERNVRDMTSDYVPPLLPLSPEESNLFDEAPRPVL